MPGADLLQVLWCPQWGHGRFPDPDPAPVVIWRDSAMITRRLDANPRPRRLSVAERDLLTTQERSQRWVRSLLSLPGFHRRDLLHQGRLPDCPSDSGLPRWFLEMPVQTDVQFEEICQAARRVLDEIQQQQQIPDYADDSLFPWPCRLFPERVTEYPRELSEEQRVRLDAAIPLVLGSTCEERELRARRELYRSELTVADGTKLQGYVRWIQRPAEPRCDHGHLMEH